MHGRLRRNPHLLAAHMLHVSVPMTQIAQWTFKGSRVPSRLGGTLGMTRPVKTKAWIDFYLAERRRHRVALETLGRAST